MRRSNDEVRAVGSVEVGWRSRGCWVITSGGCGWVVFGLTSVGGPVDDLAKVYSSRV